MFLVTLLQHFAVRLSAVTSVMGDAARKWSCAAAAMLILVSATASSPRAAEPVVAAYVPTWSNLKTFATKIDYGRLTHINFAFENPTNDKGDLGWPAGGETLVEQSHAHQVKILMSLAGGGVAGNKELRERYFHLIAPPQRAAFVKLLVDYTLAHGLDGLDLDLEGPAINADYGPFAIELAEKLHEKKKLLTAALSHSYGGKNVPDKALEAFDLIHVMAYDARGPWNPSAGGQHSSLEFAQTCVAQWLKRGVPKGKLVLGVPFYGYGFGEAFQKGGYSYSQLVARYPGAEDKDAVGNTIYYNGRSTIAAKARLVREQGLAGMMIWSLNMDASGEKSLLTTLHKSLHEKP